MGDFEIAIKAFAASRGDLETEKRVASAARKAASSLVQDLQVIRFHVLQGRKERSHMIRRRSMKIENRSKRARMSLLVWKKTLRRCEQNRPRVEAPK